ncbi:MAG: amidohydrolase family protein, partial [Blastocatellia bacterium]|nr:amidohydrolase family protein [Blastocatellia bacterium]
RGAIVIKDGKIAAVGANVGVPGNAKVIEAHGLSVYPGLIDSNTTLGLVEVPAVNSTVDTTELGDFKANMKALTAVNPNSELIPVARMNGVTTAITCPEGGIIAGQCALINLDGWTPPEMKLLSPAAMHMIYPVLGLGGRRGGSGFIRGQAQSSEQQRLLREQRVESLRKMLEEAQAYAKAKAAEAADKSIPARDTDLGLEALIPVVKGEVPVMITAEGEHEIRGAVELADKYKIKVIIEGGENAVKVASLLKERNIPVVLGPVLDLPATEDDPYDSAYARAGELYRAGVKFAFSTSTASDVRLLPYHAGTAAAFGLPKEEALKGVTLYPAQIFGVDKLVGSIETGKVANLVVTDGDILEFRTKVKHMFINGHPVDLSNKHTRLYEKFKDRQ